MQSAVAYVIKLSSTNIRRSLESSRGHGKPSTKTLVAYGLVHWCRRKQTTLGTCCIKLSAWYGWLTDFPILFICLMRFRLIPDTAIPGCQSYRYPACQRQPHTQKSIIKATAATAQKINSSPSIQTSHHASARDSNRQPIVNDAQVVSLKVGKSPVEQKPLYFQVLVPACSTKAT